MDAKVGAHASLFHAKFSSQAVWTGKFAPEFSAGSALAADLQTLLIAVCHRNGFS